MELSQMHLSQFRTNIKGIGSLDDFFCLFKAYTFQSVLSIQALTVFKCLACLVQEKNRYKASDCFFENTSKATLNFCFRLSLFLLVNFREIFQDHRRLMEQLLET
jgi:hypothetical protein